MTREHEREILRSAKGRSVHMRVMRYGLNLKLTRNSKACARATETKPQRKALLQERIVSADAFFFARAETREGETYMEQ